MTPGLSPRADSDTGTDAVSRSRRILAFLAIIVIFGSHAADCRSLNFDGQSELKSYSKPGLTDKLEVVAKLDSIPLITQGHTPGRPRPPGYDSWVEFATQNQCHLGSYDRIEKDMQAFVDPDDKNRLKITKQQIEEASQLGNVAAFTVKDGALFYDGRNEDHSRVLAWFMQRFVHLLPNMTFVINSMDEPRILPGNTQDIDARMDSDICKNASPSFQKHRHLHGFINNRITGRDYTPQTKLLPVFSQTKINDCHRDILYPPTMTLGTLLNASEIAALLPWEQRVPDLYWRGSTTGGNFYHTRVHRKAHRQRLVRLAKSKANMDIQFSGVIQCSEAICEEMVNEYGIAKVVPVAENFRHKFLMSLDGNTFVSRLPKWLSAGSLTFRAGMFSEWFDEWIFDGTHYLQIELDYSDLDTKLQWAMQHDAEAKRIAHAAQEFARTRLRFQDQECYFFRLLLEYANICEKDA